MSRMDKEFKKFLREVVIPKHKDACRAYPYNISRKLLRKVHQSGVLEMNNEILSPEEAAIEEFPMDAELLNRYDILEMIRASGGESITWRPDELRNKDLKEESGRSWYITELALLKMKSMLRSKGWLLEQYRHSNGHYMLRLTPDPDRTMAVPIKKPSAIRMCIIKVLRFLAGRK